MKVTVLSSGSIEENEQLFEPEAIKKELKRQGQKGHLDTFVILAEILRAEIPEHLLTQLSFAELTQQLIEAGNFLFKQDHEVRVKLFPLKDSGTYRLFTNSPDANHIFFSLQEYLHRRALQFHVVCHPILSVARKDGKIEVLTNACDELPRESFVWMEFERLAEGQVEEIESALKTIISAALTIYRDRPAMLQKFDELLKIKEFAGHQALFEWLKQENFIPVATRNFTYTSGDDISHFKEEKNKALGLTEFYLQPFHKADKPFALSVEKVFSLLGHGKMVDVERTELRCPLHRFERLTYLGFREKIKGGYREYCFFGFYTQKSIDENSYMIPALRQRIEKAQQQLNIVRDSHNYRKTVQIINSFPKIELFLMEEDELRRMLRSFIQMHRQAGVKVVIAPTTAEQGLTLLLIMPNEYYLPEHIERLEAYLRRYFKAVSVDIRLIHAASDYLTLHVNLQLRHKEVQVDLLKLEQGLTRLTMPWKLRFRTLLEKNFSRESYATWDTYIKAFDREYRARNEPRFAIRDLRNIEKLLHFQQDVFDLWGPFHGQRDYYRLQYYSLNRCYLNDLMPYLQNLNLYVLHQVDSDLVINDQPVYIKSFSVRADNAKSLPMAQVKAPLIETLRALNNNEVENDYLHQLLLPTGLSWRQIDVFRAYRNYYLQLGSPFSKKRVAETLTNNIAATQLLYRYFEGRFKPAPEWEDPMVRELEVLSPVRQELVKVLEDVTNPNEDKILRTLFNLIDSTIRTNFFVRCDKDDYFISFKISSLGVIDMPAPRPLYEVYVHSAQIEGVHLRGGKVARGGIRWSDRPDDFRTEVLGLVKAQMTKNAVIVPEGSKGGFVTKRSSADREQMGQIVKEAYQTFMRGLLDITDNRVGNDIVRPAGVIAHDDHDPYLVVAADKGTAHLSDVANAISDSYNFWLGDAFASGGSHGYDHKKLGITARGAWESVKRLFREMGRDIQTEPFTVVGIGDMSGDVFGNGMLLSKKIRLLAAFDHRHIFLDPDPDPETSWQERQRLFNLPRSTWEDYNSQLISAGGGIYSRQLKEIPLTPQVAKWLGVRQSSIDVPGLIKLLLTAPVDLLWNGGIGTYIKASTQNHEEAGDRANDGLRADGIEVRAKVIGEGGNLGLTQAGRIEFALNGGRVNTDAIDNSGGVDSSDHEVNLKILLRLLRQERKVKSLKAGYALLEEIEETVCQDVLANNYTQTLSISLDELRIEKDVEPHLELIDRLSRAGLLDRRGEGLPSRKDVALRQPNRLTRPELAVLLAYSKMFLYRGLLDAELPDNKVVKQLLFDYFPAEIGERYAEQVPHHPLAREITATMLTNRVVDQAGSAFLQTASRLTGRSQVSVANAYLIFDSLLSGPELRHAVYSLDNRMSAARQYELLLRLENILATFCVYALGNGMAIPATTTDLDRISAQLHDYAGLLPKVLPANVWQECRQLKSTLQNEGLNPDLAYKFSVLDNLVDFLPLLCMVDSSGQSLEALAQIKVLVDQQVKIDVLLEQLAKVPVRDSWDRQARESLISSLHAVNVSLVYQVATESAERPEAFFSQRRAKIRFLDTARQSLIAEEPQNFHPFSVLLHHLEGLVKS
jgi:glutamate dehydrogenase